MYLITGESALIKNGLTTFGNMTPLVATPAKYLDNVDNGINRYHYMDEIDTANYVSHYKDTFILPTVERAIVDYIRMEDIRDEGTLIWAIQDYIDSSKYDMNKVYEVSEFYNVPKEIIDYWFKEAREESYYSMG